MVNQEMREINIRSKEKEIQVSKTATYGFVRGFTPD